MKAERFFQIYRIVLAVLLVAMLIPMVLACGYVRPVADDLSMGYVAAKAWRETGSLWAVLKGAWQSMAQTYQGHSGIFASMYLTALPLSVFGTRWLALNPLMIMGLLLFTMCRAGQSIRLLWPQVSKACADCAGLLMCLMVFLLLPDACQGIYWHSGAINYTFFHCAAVLVLLSMLRSYKTGKSGFWRMAVWCVMAFLIGGSNWLTQVSLIVVAGAYAVWAFWQKKPKRFLIPFAFLLLGLAIAVVAPGNAVRSMGSQEKLGIPQAMVFSFAKAFLFLFRDGRMFPFLLLFVPVFMEIYKCAEIHWRFASLVPVLSICVLAATIFPLVWLSAHWQMRHTDACFYVVCILLPINAFLLFAWIGKKLNILREGMQLSVAGMTVLLVAVFGIIGLQSMQDMSFQPLRFSCTLQPVKVFSHLRDGSLKHFAEEYDELIAYVQEHPGEDIVVHSEYREEILNLDHLLTDETWNWKNTSFCSYYDHDGTIVYQQKEQPR